MRRHGSTGTAKTTGISHWSTRLVDSPRFFFFPDEGPFLFSEGVLLLKCVCFACFCSKVLWLKAWLAPSTLASCTFRQRELSAARLQLPHLVVCFVISTRHLYYSLEAFAVIYVW